MTRSEATARWRRINRQRMVFYRKYARIWNAYYLEQGNKIVTNLEDSKVDPTEGTFLTEDIRQIYLKMYQEIGVSFAQHTLVEISVEAAASAKAEEDRLITYWNELMAAYVFNDGVTQSIASISATGKAEAMRIIDRITAQAVEEGLGVDVMQRELEKAIRQEWRIKSKFNSRRIARTETMIAQNTGSLMGADQSTVPVNKVWLHNAGKGERDWHAALHMTTQPKFGEWVTALGSHMKGPGDRSAPAEDVINCRCSVTFVSARR